MVASSRWKRHDGKDYVFYDPHPGFASGAAGKQYLSYVCNVRSTTAAVPSHAGAESLGLVFTKPIMMLTALAF